MKGSCMVLVLTAALASGLSAAEEGLVAHWDFNEGKGDVLHDRSGNGNHGKIHGAKWVKIGTKHALEFDGVDDHVDCGAGPGLDIRDNISIAAWVYPKPQKALGEPGIVGKAFASYVITQSEEMLYTYISEGWQKAFVFIPLERWHHIASTYDGKALRLYLNGELVSVQPLDAPIDSGGHFWMGRSDGEVRYTKNAHFHGRIAEVRVYHAVLTPEEVADLALTTNLTGTVTAYPVPRTWKGTLLAEVDKRGLGETRDDLEVEVTVLRLDAEGRATGPALLKGSVSQFDSKGMASVELDASGLQSGEYAIRASAKRSSGEKVGLTNSARFTWYSKPKSPQASLGSSWELFTDDYLIDRLQGARLKLHHPQPAEVVLRLDQPWEVKASYSDRASGMGRTVFKDGDTYRMYYVAMFRMCYAESRDGVTWTKPALGLVEVNGGRQNNLIGTEKGEMMHRPYHEPAALVFPDTRPGVPASQRFKALRPDQGYPHNLWAWVSGDGRKWRKLQDEPIISTRLRSAFDGGFSMFWSKAEQQYVIYLRYAKQTAAGRIRSVARTTSKDFLNWTTPAPMTFGASGKVPPEHIYMNNTTPYFRGPHIYVSLAARFMPGRQVLTDEQAKAAGVPEGRWQDCSETVLMTTRGGTHYDRTFMEGFVRPGMGPLNWITRTNYALDGIVPTGPSEVSIYVNRHVGHPSWHIRRYTLRTDGFASVNARYEGGEMVTKPFPFVGKELAINYSTGASGSIRVEIQDASGRPLPGHALDDSVEMAGDEIERVVRWKGGSDVSGPAGKRIRLRFVMKDADLYSLRFK